MDPTRSGGSLLLGLVLLSCGCAQPGPTTVEDRERGCRYVVPAGWTSFDGEMRSRGSSLVSIRVFGLDGADPAFVAGLPDSILPQLEEWARSYYILEGAPTRGTAQLAGPALELNYRIRVRSTDPVSKLTYWVTRHGSRVFVLRAVYPPERLEEDERAARAMLESWSFLE